MTNHPNRKKTYPDQTFEYAARKAGARVWVLWEQLGPPKTEVAWNVCYSVNYCPVIVQTYRDGNGWNVFTTGGRNNVDASIADALNRCGVKETFDFSAATPVTTGTTSGVKYGK